MFVHTKDPGGGGAGDRPVARQLRRVQRQALLNRGLLVVQPQRPLLATINESPPTIFLNLRANRGAASDADKKGQGR